MSRENIIAGAIDFGLGPVGKLSSIINSSSGIDWYGIGSKIDQNIFNRTPFIKNVWTKDAKKIKTFCEKYNISKALIVLDPDLADTLMNIGLKVIYIDSLPFMWSELDRIPYNVSLYCAQQCLELPINCGKQLSKIKNLKWINPIIPITEEIILEKGKDTILINLGGLHSPEGDGIEYAIIVLSATFEAIKKNNFKKVKITCGHSAINKLKGIIYTLNQNNYLDVVIETLTQTAFLTEIKKCKIFITSPGLTSIYETANFNIPTIILPPQNLSQYYNSNFAGRLIKNVQIISWGESDLAFDKIEPFLVKGEIFVVRKINELIHSYTNNRQFMSNMELIIALALEKELFQTKESYSFGQNGTQQIIDEINRM